MLAALIVATTIATSSTGGNYAGPGGVVQTGSEYSSSAVETTVNRSGTTSVHVETDNNGQVRTVDQTLPDGQGVNVDVQTQLQDNVATTSVQVAATSVPVVPVQQSVSKPTTHVSVSAQVTTSAHAAVVASSTAATSTATTTSTTSLVVPTPSSMIPPSLASRISCTR